MFDPEVQNKFTLKHRQEAASNGTTPRDTMPRAGRGTAAAAEMSEAPMARDLHRRRTSKKALPERDSTPAAGPRRSKARRRTRNNNVDTRSSLPILRPVFPLDLRSQQDRPVCLWHRSARGPAVRAQVLAGRAAMARLSVLIVGVVHNARYTLHRTNLRPPCAHGQPSLLTARTCSVRQVHAAPHDRAHAQ